MVLCEITVFNNDISMSLFCLEMFIGVIVQFVWQHTFVEADWNLIT